MKLFILLFFFLTTSLNAIELSVPPLKPQKILINSIKKFNNMIIVRTDNWDENKEKWENSLWKLNHDKKTITPFLDKKSSKIVAIFQNDKNLQIYATRKGNAVFLKYLNNPKRNMTVRVMANQDFKLAANNKFTYLLFKDEIILISNKKTKTINLSTLDVSSRNQLPSSIAINNKSLFLGYNKGEWGGSLYKLSIGKTGDFIKNRYLMSENIDTIKLDTKGNTWITTSLAHLGVVHSGLYKYNKKIETVIEQNGFSIGFKPKFKSSGSISLPTLTSINGMTISTGNKIIFVAPSVGILSINKSLNLGYLWKGQLYFRYDEPLIIVNNSKKEVITSSIRSSPEGIIIVNKNIFIASRTLGVLEFSKINNGNYAPTSQYTFKVK